MYFRSFLCLLVTRKINVLFLGLTLMCTWLYSAYWFCCHWKSLGSDDIGLLLTVAHWRLSRGFKNSSLNSSLIFVGFCIEGEKALVLTTFNLFCSRSSALSHCNCVWELKSLMLVLVRFFTLVFLFLTSRYMQKTN